MTLKHLRIFLEVYRSQNITQAAAKLNMTQPAVSRSIQELEAYYDIRLFERMNRRLYITEYGRALYNHALPLIESFDLIEKEIKMKDNTNHLRIGASISIGNFLLPDLICHFRQSYPNVKIQAMIANSCSLQNALENNHLDIAMIEGSVTNSMLHTESFHRDHLVLIVCPGHPLSEKSYIKLEDITDYDLLLREPGSSSRDFLENIFALHDLTLSPAWESTSSQALIKAVSKGIGISLLSESLVQEAVQNNIVCTCAIQNESMLRENYLVWHKNKYISPIMEKMIAFCHSQIHNNIHYV